MTVHLHPPEEYLLGYCAGALREAEGLWVACHAALCAACRARIRNLEAVAGTLLAHEERAPLSADLLTRTLSSLSQHPGTSEPSPAPAPDPVLPPALVRYVGPFAALRWQKAMRSVWYVNLPISLGSEPVRLVRFAPGLAIPRHAHRDVELELVLTGRLFEEGSERSLSRGDVSCRYEDEPHALVIDAADECIALSVHSARVRPVGLWSTLVFGYLGW